MQKKAIFAQLRDFIGQLRSLEPRILVVFKQWTRLVSFILEYAWMIVHLGHFPLLQNFILTLATTACSISSGAGNTSHQSKLWLKDTIGSPLLTWICPRNMLAQNGNVVAIVDWECAGWYPEYWEYTRWAVSSYRSPQTWLDARDNIMDVYSEELQVEDLIGGVYTRL